jgi:hypothetical protein
MALAAAPIAYPGKLVSPSAAVRSGGRGGSVIEVTSDTENAVRLAWVRPPPSQTAITRPAGLVSP